MDNNFIVLFFNIKNDSFGLFCCCIACFLWFSCVFLSKISLVDVFQSGMSLWKRAFSSFFLATVYSPEFIWVFMAADPIKR